MPQRVSLIFDVTTAPTDREAASPHSGGWSESQWTLPHPTLLDAYIRPLATYRAYMLPSLASITGWRIEDFTISGNRILPNGTTSGHFQYPGSNANGLNIPQDALQAAGAGTGVPNGNRFTLRCLPDDCTNFGEYQPTPNFKRLFTQYGNRLVTDNWGFIGRDKTQPSIRVMAIAAGVVTLNGAIGGTNNVSFVRLNRVTDDNGKPVKGTFLMTAGAGTNTITLQGLNKTLTHPSGTARIDLLTFIRYASVVPSRAVSRKVGRPSSGYRGRKSKVRA